MTTTTSNRYALAIDIGGTKVEAALVDPNGVVLATSRFRAPTGRAASSEQLAESVRSVVQQSAAALPAAKCRPSTCRPGATSACVLS